MISFMLCFAVKLTFCVYLTTCTYSFVDGYLGRFPELGCDDEWQDKISEQMPLQYAHFSSINFILRSSIAVLHGGSIFLVYLWNSFLISIMTIAFYIITTRMFRICSPQIFTNACYWLSFSFNVLYPSILETHNFN